MKNNDLKNKIIETKLNNPNLNYTEIAKILNCNRVTVSCYLNPEIRKKVNNRSRKQKANNNNKDKNNVLKIKVERFKQQDKIKEKYRFFKKDKKTGRKSEQCNFTYQDLLERIINSPECYLTGRKIDIYNPQEYQLDHVIPKSRNGSNNLDNLGLACKQANQAKSDLLLHEFIDLCKDVLLHNGYEVNKKVDKNILK
jgi:5-methylcytosine-specific restriction endonuclease McrA